MASELSRLSRRVCLVFGGLVRLARHEFNDFTARLAQNFHVSFDDFEPT